MRVVTYRGVPVKRQRKVGDYILLTFYDRPRQKVSCTEWETFAENKFYDSSVRRSDVVRGRTATSN
ncbi:hypothetical protein EBZ39_03460 [bacterium]|nr:hypothetical protein [bacterium]